DMGRVGDVKRWNESGQRNHVGRPRVHERTRTGHADKLADRRMGIGNMLEDGAGQEHVVLSADLVEVAMSVDNDIGRARFARILVVDYIDRDRKLEAGADLKFLRQGNRQGPVAAAKIEHAQRADRRRLKHSTEVSREALGTAKSNVITRL